ncbi:hypothetical protein BC826DRAFT_1063873 [Russula brevipes]|nr:hypothetical protein BC826DRAFT_1063873 [Russula brevipes]
MFSVQARYVSSNRRSSKHSNWSTTSYCTIRTRCSYPPPLMVSSTPGTAIRPRYLTLSQSGPTLTTSDVSPTGNTQVPQAPRH